MATIEEDLNQFEKDIRQLKIEYEQYFGGGRKRPPTEIEWRIELIQKRYSDRSAQMSFPQRFRFGNLTQTYAKYKEIFRKRLKQREEGAVQRHFGAAAKAIEMERARLGPPPPPVQPAAARPEGVRARTKHPETGQKDAEGERLYLAFYNAKQEAGEDTSKLTRERFREFLEKTSNRLKGRTASKQIEYVVTKEKGQVRLKARVKE